MAICRPHSGLNLGPVSTDLRDRFGVSRLTRPGLTNSLENLTLRTSLPHIADVAASSLFANCHTYRAHPLLSTFVLRRPIPPTTPRRLFPHSFQLADVLIPRSSQTAVSLLQIPSLFKLDP